MFFLFLVCFSLPLTQAHAGAESGVEVTILHTNDLHSHFRETSYPFKMGGLARIKTAIDTIRQGQQYTAVVDAGDWSEGSIYYTAGVGRESVRMLDHIGYDFAVVGNHDWLNGPDTLLDAIRLAQPRTRFLAYNLDIPDQYPRKEEFQRTVLPYSISDYGGYKIGWIGLSTYEWVYDRFFQPIKITNPFTAAAGLARYLKNEMGVDGVIVLSHNSIKMNQLIIRAANELGVQNYIDLVIGAHDHIKLTRPVEVRRLVGGPAAWIVETGMGGSYLGQVKVRLTRGHVELENYQLIQMDSRIQEDQETLERVENLERQIEGKFGPIFDDVVGESHVDFTGMGVENLMGDFIADCYRSETGADLAIESNRFVYNPIRPGKVTYADTFNAVPPIYSAESGKTWTTQTFPMKGSTLKWLLYFLFGSKKLSSYGLVNVSGLKFKYDPLFATKFANEADEFEEPTNLADDLRFAQTGQIMGAESIPVVTDIRIQDSSGIDQPLHPSAHYTVATGGGLIEAIQFINKKLWTIIPLDGLKDTGKENWKVLANQIRARSPLTVDKVTVGDRIRTTQPNLGIYPLDVSWAPLEFTRAGRLAQVRAKIRNYGATRSEKGPTVKLLINKNRSDLSIDPDYLENPKIYSLSEIEPGDFQEVSWQVVLPEVEGAYPVTLRILGADREVNTTNHETTVWLRNYQN